MIKHVVLWKLDDSYSAGEKEKILAEFKSKLIALKDKIDVLKSLSVGFNSKEAAPANYDIMLETTFNSIAGLSAYQVHPDHLKVVEFVGSIKKQRACIDFEF